MEVVRNICNFVLRCNLIDLVSELFKFLKVFLIMLNKRIESFFKIQMLYK